MGHPAFGIHLVKFQPASLRHAQTMPEHEEQQAAVAGLVPASLGRLDQPLDLAPGEVLPVAVVLPRVSAFAPVHHFVESSPRPMPLKPA